MTEQLQVEVGVASETGKRAANEDFCAAHESEGNRATRELVAVIADGLGGGPGGRLASETTVRGFIEGYFSLPETLGVDRAAHRALASMNRWVCAHGRQDEKLRGMATTFSALILRGRSAHVVHLGDSRVYRLRERQLQRLTEDHVHAHPDLSHVLYRAVGLEENARADYARHDLRAHDRYLLCSDGVHAVLKPAELTVLLSQQASPQEDARRIIERALEAGSQDNVSAVVVDVVSVPSTERADLELAMARLPIEELPRAGDTVDGFQLVEMISDGHYSRLFRAQDTREPREVVLKFPHPRVASDAVYRRAFTREAWVAAQVRSPFVAEVIELPPERQTRLYSVMPYYRGQTLEQRLKQAPVISLKEGMELGLKLAKAVYALNRQRIVHRDIKPDNVLLTSEAGGGVKLLDLGVARLPGVEESESEEIPGTPSYMAPELFGGNSGDEHSEVYAIGVTLYRVFSGGQYPYGEVEAFSTPRFNKRTPLARYRPDLPAWLDACLARATAVNPRDRHGDAIELALDLENNYARGPAVKPKRKVSLYERNPLRFWQVLAGILFLGLVLSLITR
ncbi:MAG TPA: protein kinase [Burkholderiaceae bacterium]|nr:protein kinase [Burkholderiaceae bacterium]